MADNKLPLFEGAGKFYVYLYRDPRPKKKLVPIYVGKGTAKRKRADIHWREGARNPILAALFDKFVALDLEPIIEIVGWYDDEDAAFAAEIAFIARFGRRDKKTGTLCNLTDGGEGPSGFIPDPNHIARLAEISSQRPRPDDERRRISEALMGHAVSPETREKIAAKHRGRTLPDEMKRLLSARQTAVMSDPLVRQARRDSMIGRKHTPEVCAKIGDAHRGKIVSSETREKLRIANLGKTTPDHVKAKLSQSVKDYWAKRRLLETETPQP